MSACKVDAKVIVLSVKNGIINDSLRSESEKENRGLTIPISRVI